MTHQLREAYEFDFVWFIQNIAKLNQTKTRFDLVIC